MGDWAFEHSVVTRTRGADAWAYWTDLRNHARMEPGVERIELDGPFATGTTVTGWTPDGAGTLSFAWAFEDAGDGTRMTQRISATGPQVAAYSEEFRRMEARAPEGMARLAAELDRLTLDAAPDAPGDS